MEKKNYIQPNIKCLIVQEDLMAALSGGETNGNNTITINPEETPEEGSAKDNTWHTTSVWD